MSATLQILNGDIVMNGPSGRPTLLLDQLATKQHIKEFMNIEVLPNGFGAGIDQFVGIVAYQPMAFATMVDSQIQDGISTFINLQRSNNKIVRSNAELINSASTAMVYPNPTDQTSYFISVIWYTGNNQQIPMTELVNIGR